MKTAQPARPAKRKHEQQTDDSERDDNIRHSVDDGEVVLKRQARADQSRPSCAEDGHRPNSTAVDRCVVTGEPVATCTMLVAVDKSLVHNLLSQRLGVDHLHDLPYPELTAKEKKRAVIDPPPLLLRREEVYVAAREGIVNSVRARDTSMGTTRSLSAQEFIDEVDSTAQPLYIEKVFYHYWKKGLVISPATKFGGHFLLYESDRDTEHVRTPLLMS